MYTKGQGAALPSILNCIKNLYFVSDNNIGLYLEGDIILHTTQKEVQKKDANVYYRHQQCAGKHMAKPKLKLAFTAWEDQIKTAYMKLCVCMLNHS